MTRQLSTWIRPVLLYGLLLIFLLWTVAPVGWIGIMSFQPEINYISVPPRLSLATASLQWYQGILANPLFTANLLNSVIIATATTILTLVLATLAAYPLARLNLPFKNVYLVVTMFTRMIPGMVLIVPMFLLMRDLHLLDTYTALVLVYTAFLLPYVIWMLKNFFEQIPYSLEAAARMDGCSRLGALFRVMLPVSGPGVIATAIFCFIGAWNEFLFGLVLSTSKAVPVTVRISSLLSATYNTDNSQVAAAGMIAILPVVVVVFLLNRYIIRGLLEGVKV